MTQPCCSLISLQRLFALGVAFSGSILAPVYADEGEGGAFYRDKVYPILKENCFKCHGAEEHLKSDFRLTSREGLVHGGHFGPGYNEEDPAASVLLAMISYDDADHEMPPKGKLSEEHLATLREWMAAGAPYDPELEIKGSAQERRGFTVSDEDRQWWAYLPIAEDDPPAVEEEWSRNGIDAFIKAQLDREKLVPNERATPGVLVRRLFFDLIGLPPTPREVDAFVAASEVDSEAAYTALVEDLLSRPQYGEKWARHWLDVVRYAETNGFERDASKPHIWRYRDYVIDAFNNDKPYDQFVIEQIAGDEIAEPTMESMIATGYHRLMQWDDEPADRKQHVYDVLADNVQVTTETFLATTVGCARCHDHKADPVSQKDFYSFMALYSGVTHYSSEGTLVSWAGSVEKKRFEKEREAALARLTLEKNEQEAELMTYLSRKGGSRNRIATEPITYLEDARGGGDSWFYTTKQPTDDWSEIGFLNKSWFKAKGGFGAGDPPRSIIKTEWKTNDIWMRTTFGLTAVPDSLTLEIYHDEEVEVYLNGQLVYEAGGYTTDYEVIELGEKALGAIQTGKNVVAVHCRNSGGGQNIDLSLRTSSSTAGLQELVSGKKGKRFAQEVKKNLGRDLAGDYAATLDEISRWRTRTPGVQLNVVTERRKNAPAMHIHLRGSAHALGEEVYPGLPAVLASDDSEPLPVEATPVERDGRASAGRRLQLANWIVSPENVITPRVMVNRLWHHHFGRGIVPSTSDFGQLGEKPTHPELLDWLAGQFVAKGWSIKEMHRLMLHSRTYQMSSEPNSANLASDPQNNHFWRFSMRRLTAEELRDTMLSVTGSLNPSTHGEWVFPPLPPEVLATSSKPEKVWPVSAKEEDHTRRSLYVHVKRSLRHQMLADFDQADTDTACAVRFATTVPTQALTMLNSRFVNDQAKIFAGRMRETGGSVREQIAAGLRLALQRRATEDELEYLVNFQESLQREMNLSADEALDRVALLALNLNEFIYLD
ncbi:MAG: PSD1 and planctomycete cytochrome C domain-containing protein [Verrucomicrobiales bacterium]|nr:PSD1 and planctomycete cytochrome C domain-containing protein [Verrucomicrobiales bacterium]